MQHVPGIDEKDKTHTSQRDQRIAKFAPQPAPLLFPGLDSVVQSGQRAQHSEPANDLYEAKQWIEPRAEQTYILFREREKCQESAHEKKIA